MSALAESSTVSAPVRTARPCPVCGQRLAALLLERRYALFDDSPLPRATQVVRCASCATAFASSDASADAYRAHYARHSKYDTAIAASGSGESPLDHERLRETAAYLVARVGADARVLDVGAGRGGLLAALIDAGVHAAEGIDPSAGCAATMRARGLRGAQGLIEDAAWPVDPRTFDLVVLSHVLEHVFDAADAVRRVALRVAEGGCIYVEVPDAGRYTTHGFPPFYFFDPEHINHFDAASLDALARATGWTVERTWTRLLRLDGGQSYPALGALLRRGAAVSAVARTDALADYITQSAALARAAIDRAFADAVTRGTSVVVWGAGSHAQRLLSSGVLADAAIDCVIDNDAGKQGRRLDGHLVVGSEEGLSRAQALGAIVAVAIAVDPTPVVAQVRHRLPHAKLFVL